MELKWVCLYKDCGHINLADFLKTATPICEVCGQKYWWDEILPEKQMAAGNALLDSYAAVVDVVDRWFEAGLDEKEEIDVYDNDGRGLVYTDFDV